VAKTVFICKFLTRWRMHNGNNGKASQKMAKLLSVSQQRIIAVGFIQRAA